MPAHKPHPEAVRIAVVEPFNPLSLRWVRGFVGPAMELTQFPAYATRYAPSTVNHAIRAAKQQMPGGTVTIFRGL